VHVLSNTSPFKVKEITFSCSAHSTEDSGKVKQAILNLVPNELHTKIEISDLELTGHAGNIIHLLELTIKSNRDVKATMQFLSTKIDDLDKEYLFEEIDERIDKENCVYMRFNKQEAFKERIVLDDKDNTIKVVIKFIIYKSEPDLIKNALVEYGLIRK
jgi:RNA binding exosome subunit